MILQLVHRATESNAVFFLSIPPAYAQRQLERPTDLNHLKIHVAQTLQHHTLEATTELRTTVRHQNIHRSLVAVLRV